MNDRQVWKSAQDNFKRKKPNKDSGPEKGISHDLELKGRTPRATAALHKQEAFF